MFNVSDTVVYGTAGVCVVSEIREMSAPGKAGESKKYYVLSPLDKRGGSTLFVPVENENLTSKMKRIMTKDEAELMLNDKTEYVKWIEERRTRADEYSKIITCGEKREVLTVLRLLYGAKVEAESRGKKQYMADKKNLDLAEKVVGEELSYVYELPRQNIAKYIYERMSV